MDLCGLMPSQDYFVLERKASDQPLPNRRECAPPVVASQEDFEKSEPLPLPVFVSVLLFVLEGSNKLVVAPATGLLVL
jgi:hypothetical protein